MDFWLLDVQSTIKVKGKDVAFDYINTYFDSIEAVNEARLLRENDDILQVLVVHWNIDEYGNQDAVECIFSYINMNHREMRKGGK